MPRFEKVEGKKRRLGSDEEEEVLITPLGPRAVCGGLLRRVGKESVFKDADPRCIPGGSSTPAAVGYPGGRKPGAKVEGRVAVTS